MAAPATIQSVRICLRVRENCPQQGRMSLGELRRLFGEYLTTGMKQSMVAVNAAGGSPVGAHDNWRTVAGRGFAAAKRSGRGRHGALHGATRSAMLNNAEHLAAPGRL